MSVLAEISREYCCCCVSVSQRTLCQSDAAPVNGRAKCKTHSFLLKRAMMIMNREILKVNYIV